MPDVYSDTHWAFSLGGQRIYWHPTAPNCLPIHVDMGRQFRLSLLRADWFLECAASCVWQDEDGEEDVLSQVRETRGSVQ